MVCGSFRNVLLRILLIRAIFQSTLTQAGIKHLDVQTIHWLSVFYKDPYREVTQCNTSAMLVKTQLRDCAITIRKDGGWGKGEGEGFI